MSIPQAINIGIGGNEISKKITGTSEVSAGRTAVATAAGGIGGAVTAGALTVWEPLPSVLLLRQWSSRSPWPALLCPSSRACSTGEHRLARNIGKLEAMMVS